MTGPLRWLRGALGMGVLWAVGWGLCGLLIGVASLFTPWLPWDRFFEVFDAPLPTLAVPGFLGGALFSTVLTIAGRGRRFHELSLGKFAAWGALGGLMVALIPIALTTAGLATASGSGPNLWLITLAIVGPMAGVGALSASGSLLLARKGEARELPLSSRSTPLAP